MQTTWSGALAIRVRRNGKVILECETWDDLLAAKVVEIGDDLEADMANGGRKCADVLPFDNPAQGPILWKSVEKPC